MFVHSVIYSYPAIFFLPQHGFVIVRIGSSSHSNMLAAHGQYRPDNIFIETVGFLWIVGNMPGARAGYKNNSADRAPQ